MFYRKLFVFLIEFCLFLVITILLCVSLDVFATKEPAITEIYDSKQLDKLTKVILFTKYRKI